ncbi:MAG: putative lipid II flippase FtsW [Syntrophomonadaceae bacterium]|mgnify:CR=1 FL=1|nr:putative lipid II flippase FtsW [Syntrophomonadaceae bacterium]
MKMRKGPPDLVLFLVVFLLVAIGIIMIFSASAVTANIKYQDPFLFLRKQAIWIVLGFILMLVAMKLNYHRLRELGVAAIIISVLSLIAVLLPGIGSTVKGAARQIDLGFTSFTPSELAKLCTVIFMASSLSRNFDKIKSFTKGLLPYLLFLGVICGLIILQPDLGTTFAIAVTGFLMLAMSGARYSHLGILALVGMVLVGLAIYLEPYRMIRFIAFLDPWKYANDAGFQTIQSLYALGSGGLFGMGLGQSRQKFFYLPEQHTDFIFAILGEELGYLGVILVLGLFLIFAWRGFRIALKAPDSFGSLLAAGLTTMVMAQALINLGVVSGSLPVTGIPLPFISFGGSSLIFTLIAVGLLLNISRYVYDR